MSADPSTVRAVATLLAADPNVSADFRLAVVEGLSSGESINLENARRMLGVGRTTLWRMRKQGRVSLPKVDSLNAKETRVPLSSVVKIKESKP